MDADFEPQDSADFQPETLQEPSEPAVNMEDFIFGVHPFDLMAFALVLLILCSVFKDRESPLQFMHSKHDDGCVFSQCSR